MGLDSYVYKVDRKKHEAYVKALNEARDLSDKNGEEIARLCRTRRDLVADLMARHPEFNGLFSRSTMTHVATSSEVDAYDELTEKIDALSGDGALEAADSTPGEELAYWRKPYPLHAYISAHFLEGNTDNCTRIPLSRSDIGRLIADLKDDLTHWNLPDDQLNFGWDAFFWTREIAEKAVKKFESILKDYDDEKDTVYYYAWY